MKAMTVSILLSLTLLVNLFINLGPQSLLALIKSVAVQKNITPVYLCVGTDNLLLNELPPEGNVFMRFLGFDVPYSRSDASKNIDDSSFWLRMTANFDDFSALDFADVAALVYFRAVHTLYPRKVLACPDGKIVTNGRQLIANRFEPELEWLQAHDVRSVLTLIRDENGNIHKEVTVLPP